MSTEENAAEGQKRITLRFGDDLLQAGFTSVPNLILRYYACLDLTPSEMMFIIHIWQFWWTEKDPYPSLGKVAAQMMITRRQAQKYVASLRQKSYINVQERYLPGLGQLTSEYDFSPFLEIIRVLHTLVELVAKKEDQLKVAAAVGTVFSQSDVQAVQIQAAEVARSLRLEFPEVAAQLQERVEAVVRLKQRTPTNSSSRGGMNSSSQGPQNSSSPEEDPEEEYPVEPIHINTSKDSDPVYGNSKGKRGAGGNHTGPLPVDTVDNSGPSGAGEDRFRPRRSLPRGDSAAPALQARQSPGDLTSIGQLLPRIRRQVQARVETTKAAARGRAPKPTPYIEQLLTDWSAELHDEEHTKSNVTQAMRLYKASGLSEDAFVGRLYEARSITKQRGNIAKQVNGGGLPGLKNKMPYYFAVLRDLLGLKDPAPGDHSSAGSATPPG